MNDLGYPKKGERGFPKYREEKEETGFFGCVMLLLITIGIIVLMITSPGARDFMLAWFVRIVIRSLIP